MGRDIWGGLEHDASGAMKIDVETQCIITRETGEQIVVDDVSSIAVVIEVMGQKYNLFKTINELILNRS